VFNDGSRAVSSADKGADVRVLTRRRNAQTALSGKAKFGHVRPIMINNRYGVSHRAKARCTRVVWDGARPTKNQQGW
jgi:hypothetical protein